VLSAGGLELVSPPAGGANGSSAGGGVTGTLLSPAGAGSLPGIAGAEASAAGAAGALAANR